MVEYTPEFEEAWKVYGTVKNSSKIKAFRAYKRLVKVPDRELFLAEIKAYKNWLIQESKNRREPFPQCHMATWINQARFDGFEEDARKLLQADSVPAISPEANGWNPGWVGTLRCVGVDANDMEKWFFPATLIYYQSQYRIELSCPSPFHAQELEKRFGKILRKAFGESVVLSVAQKQKEPQEG